MSIHIRRGEEQFGPYTPEQVATYLADGNLLPTDLAWKADVGAWVQVTEMVPAGASDAAPVTSGQTATAKKGSKKLVIGIAAGVVVLAALIVVFVVKPFGNSGSNGEAKDAKQGADKGLPVVAATPLPAPKPKGPTKTSFTEVTKHLDAGGPIYVYLSATQVQGWIQNLFDQGEQLIAASEKEMGRRDAEEARMALRVGKAAYVGIGLDSIDGVGLSSFDLGNGINRNVAMVHHDPAKGSGLMWRMFGASPHELGALKLMPEETAFLIQGDLDLNALLVWAKDFVPKNAPPDIARDMASFLAEANQAMNMERLIGSVDGELGIGITLDMQKTVNVNPGGATGLKIPEPGLIVFLKVKDSTLFDMLNQQISNLGDSGMQKQNVGDVTLYTMQIPQNPEIPVPLSPTLFQSGQYMVLTSTVDLAKNVMAVHGGSDAGLSGTEEFKRLGSGMELSGNHLFFTSDRVATVVGNTLDKVLEMEGDDLPEAVRNFIKNSATSSFKGQLTVVKVLPEGYLVNNHTTGSGLGSMLLAGSIAPVGILASMLLPALAKAKQRANTIKSVSNIRQLTSGLMAYADDNRGQLPPPNQWCDAIFREVGHTIVFTSPHDQATVGRARAGAKISSYALNAAAAGRNINSLNPRTVLVFECPLGWNGVGTPQQLVQYLQSQTKVTTVAVGMADGSAMQANLQTLQLLRWTP